MSERLLASIVGYFALATAGVLPEALAVVVVQKLWAKRFAHRAGAAQVLLEQLFQAVGRLGVAVSETGPFGRLRKDVRRAEMIAIDRDLFPRLGQCRTARSAAGRPRQTVEQRQNDKPSQSPQNPERRCSARSATK